MGSIPVLIIYREKGKLKMSEEKNVLTGTVKWFDGEKGYGFITADDTRLLYALFQYQLTKRKEVS